MKVSLIHRWGELSKFQLSNKIYRDGFSGTHYLWPIWPTRLAVVLIAIMMIALAAGCSTCPPCAPGQTIVDNPIPVYSCPEPPEFIPFTLLPWPILPDDPTPEQIKAWYVDVTKTIDLQISGCMSSLQTCTSLLDAYRPQ